LHVECAVVKGIGNKVCPLCVEEPKNLPKEETQKDAKGNKRGKEKEKKKKTKNTHEEEISADIENELPMKPNQI